MIINSIIQVNIGYIPGYNCSKDRKTHHPLCRWCTEYKKYGEFHEGYRPRSVPAADASDDTGSKNNSDADKIKQLQQEVDYLKQEMEFLKKISSIRTTRK